MSQIATQNPGLRTNQLSQQLRQALPPTALGTSADHQRKYFHVVVENDIRLADVLRPSFWMHCADRVAPGTLIDVVRKDLSLDVQLRVIKVGVGFVTVRRRFGHIDDSNLAKETMDDADISGEVPEGYKVAYMPNGTDKGYYAQHAATGKFVKKGMPNRGAAITEAQRHFEEANAVAEG